MTFLHIFDIDGDEHYVNVSCVTSIEYSQVPTADTRAKMEAASDPKDKAYILANGEMIQGTVFYLNNGLKLTMKGKFDVKRITEAGAIEANA